MYKIRNKFTLLLFILSAVTISSYATTIVDASKFGVKPDSKQNASPAIRAAIEACKNKSNVLLKLPAGRIDLWPEGCSKRELYISNSTENDTLSKVRNIGFLLENMDNVTIEGTNTRIILHGKMISFAFIKCSAIQMKNITFDYERPTMSEMTLLTVKNNQIRAKIHPDSDYSIDSKGKISFHGEGWTTKSFHTIRFSPGSDRMAYSSFKPFLEARATDEGHRIVTFTGMFDTSKYRVNDVLTIRDPYRDNVGAFINQSRNITLNNLTMRYMHGLGIVSQFSENLTYTNINIAPDKKSGRIISSFADCFHFSGCKGQILIDNCHTSGAHDDAINVHGTHLKITSIDGNKVKVRFMHPQTWGFDAFASNDSVAFINPQTLLAKSYGKIKSAQLINKREMLLELAHPLSEDLKVGDCVENLTNNPDVTIRNCRFERTNTRGVLMTTRGKVLIENNVFYHTGMHAILIADDARSWYESGPVRDVTIRNNVFDCCGYNLSPESFVIAIAPENTIENAATPVHQNVFIRFNRFKLAGNALIKAKSTSNLIFTNNNISWVENAPKPVRDPVARFEACSKILFHDNVCANNGKIKFDILKSK